MNYKFKNNTYSATPKENPKDRITIEVGDSKQLDFKPQFKLMRWDNEVNASFRFIDKELENKTPILEDGKIKISSAKKEVHFYELSVSEELIEGGFEFDIILKEKPTTNVLEFSFETKGLDFHYQGELDPFTDLEEVERLLGWVTRPDNIIGSYAVYHKTKGVLNDIAGMEYRVGKAFHIHRPKIEDAEGKWVWGELNVDIDSGILTVTIPQDFLDNAVYPIRHAAGLIFGYEGVGGTESSNNSGNDIWGLGPFSPASSGNASSMSVYFSSGSGEDFTLGIYSDDTDYPATLLKDTGGGVGGDTGWQLQNLDSALAIIQGTDYWLAMSFDDNIVCRYDTVAGFDRERKIETYVSGTLPGPFPAGAINTASRKYFIYVTYESGAPETAVKDIIQSGIIPFAR